MGPQEVQKFPASKLDTDIAKVAGNILLAKPTPEALARQIIKPLPTPPSLSKEQAQLLENQANCLKMVKETQAKTETPTDLKSVLTKIEHKAPSLAKLYDLMEQAKTTGEHDKDAQNRILRDVFECMKNPDITKLSEDFASEKAPEDAENLKEILDDFSEKFCEFAAKPTIAKDKTAPSYKNAILIFNTLAGILPKDSPLKKSLQTTLTKKTPEGDVKYAELIKQGKRVGILKRAYRAKQEITKTINKWKSHIGKVAAKLGNYTITLGGHRKTTQVIQTHLENLKKSANELRGLENVNNAKAALKNSLIDFISSKNFRTLLTKEQEAYRNRSEEAPLTTMTRKTIETLCETYDDFTQLTGDLQRKLFINEPTDDEGTAIENVMEFATPEETKDIPSMTESERADLKDVKKRDVKRKDALPKTKETQDEIIRGNVLIRRLSTPPGEVAEPRAEEAAAVQEEAPPAVEETTKTANAEPLIYVDEGKLITEDPTLLLTATFNNSPGAGQKALREYLDPEAGHPGLYQEDLEGVESEEKLKELQKDVSYKAKATENFVEAMKNMVSETVQIDKETSFDQILLIIETAKNFAANPKGKPPKDPLAKALAEAALKEVALRTPETAEKGKAPTSTAIKEKAGTFLKKTKAKIEKTKAGIKSRIAEAKSRKAEKAARNKLPRGKDFFLSEKEIAKKEAREEAEKAETTEPPPEEQPSSRGEEPSETKTEWQKAAPDEASPREETIGTRKPPLPPRNVQPEPPPLPPREAAGPRPPPPPPPRTEGPPPPRTEPPPLPSRKKEAEGTTEAAPSPPRISPEDLKKRAAQLKKGGKPPRPKRPPSPMEKAMAEKGVLPEPGKSGQPSDEPWEPEPETTQPQAGKVSEKPVPEKPKKPERPPRPTETPETTKPPTEAPKETTAEEALRKAMEQRRRAMGEEEEEEN